MIHLTYYLVMVGKAAPGRRCSQRDINDVRYLRMKGRSLIEAGRKLEVCYQTVGKWIRKYDLDRKLTEQEYVRCAIRYHFDRNSDRLEDASLPIMEFVRISIIHDRQGRMLLGPMKGKDQMADEMPKRKFEDMSDDELRAMLVRLGLGVETKSERRRVSKTLHAEDCTCPFHGAGEASAETADD